MVKSNEISLKGNKYIMKVIVGLGISLIIAFTSIQANASTIDDVTGITSVTQTITYSRGWTAELDGKIHYITGDGSYKTGWLKVLERDYSYYSFLDEFSDMDAYPYKAYLDSNGVKMTGWINDNNKWFYLDNDGIMLINTVVDGYKLGADGALIEKK